MKSCSKCSELLPLHEFWTDKSNKSGLKSSCIACCKTAWNAKPGRPPKGRAEYVPPTEKFCNGCEQTLPASSFSVRHERAKGKALRARCKQCVGKAHDEWRAKNPGASRVRNLKSKYGISEAEYMKMLDEQGGGCALCGSKESKWATSPWLHVDHNHDTGEVRGLLCHLCNIVVGGIEKTPDMDIDKLLKWCDR
jgi:hypothetical protein